MSTELEKRVIVLEKEIEVNSSYLGRLDDSIEKLTDVSTRVTTLLEVHEHRIDQADETFKLLTSLIEKRKDDAEAKFVEQDEKIEKLRTWFDEKFTTLTADFRTDVTALSTKLGDVTKYVWMIVGIGMAIQGFCSIGIPIISAFISHSHQH